MTAILGRPQAPCGGNKAFFFVSLLQNDAKELQASLGKKQEKQDFLAKKIEILEAKLLM